MGILSRLLKMPEFQARMKEMEQMRQQRDLSVNSTRTGFTDVSKKPSEDDLKKIASHLAGRVGRF